MLFVELLGDLRGLFAVRIGRDRVERLNAALLRVGVGDVSAESFAAEDDDETVFFDRFDEDFDAGNRNRLEELNDFDALFGRNAARAAVGNIARLVDRAEVAAHADVVRADRERDAGCFENAAANLEDER